MQLAMIGLGRMGGNMAERLLRDGHERRRLRPKRRKRSQKYARPWREGRATDLRDVAVEARGAARRMDHGAGRQAGGRHDRRARCPGLPKGDVIIDGGNSNFHDSMRRAAELRASEASSSSTPAPAAASGGSRTATA